MFGIWKRKIKGHVIYAPLTGRLVPLENVPDSAFRNRQLGDGIAIEPDEDVLRSPVEGEIKMIFPTGHAIGIVGSHGEEILIHIGIDTVCLEGKHFQVHRKVGQHVRVGSKLISFDREKIREEGYCCLTMLLLSNYEKYELTYVKTETAAMGEELIEIHEKAI